MKKYFLALFFLIGILQISFSQDKKSNAPASNKVKDIRDSVRIILSMPESKDKANYLFRLGDVYRFSKADSAILYYSLSEEIALKLKDAQFLPTIHKAMGFVYGRLKSNYSRSLYYAILSKKDHEAIDSYKKAISINNKNHIAYFNLAHSYLRLGRHEKALSCLQIVLNLNPKFDQAYNAISVIYTNIGKFEQAYENIKKAEIDGLILIGGDGTFTGGMIFNEEYKFPCIGIPGTIDNDIFGTNYTIGYDTALNTVVEAIDKIRDTASSHNRLFFVEVMGRDAGFIALNAGVGAGAEEILIPEENLGLERLLESLLKSRRSGKSSSIVVVAEGDKSGKNVFELAKYVEDNMPEYDVRVSVLGHMQRGGSPSCFDRVLASRLGVKAVEILIDNKTNLMVGLKNNIVITTDLEEAITGGHEINKELLRVSDIMST